MSTEPDEPSPVPDAAGPVLASFSEFTEQSESVANLLAQISEAPKSETADTNAPVIIEFGIDEALPESGSGGTDLSNLEGTGPRVVDNDTRLVDEPIASQPLVSPILVLFGDEDPPA